MKIRIIIYLVLFSTISAFAGFGEKAPIRWGKISRSEFSIKPLGSDSAAPAVVLCDYGTIDVSNRTFYRHHTRIKIINEAGLKYASVEIPYQTRNRHDDFTQLRARTLVMENGRITTYRLPESQIENIKVNDRWSKWKFTFPHARPGAIIEYEYTNASLDFETLDTWYFQREIPTLWSELRFQVPVPFVYLMTFENNRELSKDEEQVYVKQLQWLYGTGQLKRRMELSKTNELLYATSENKFKVWAMNNMKKKIIMKNLPGLSSVADENSVKDFYPRVRFDLFESSGNLPGYYKKLILTTRDDYETRGIVSLMNDRSVLPGYIHFRLKTWAEFNSNLLQNERFGRYLLRAQGGTRLLDSIMIGKKDEIARIAAINQYVRNAFKWNGQFSMYVTQDFTDFIKNRSGSSAEINLLLVSLLRHAGIKADPLLIRTTDLGAPEKMYPVKNQFNHVIAVAEIKGSRVLLDATSSSAEINKLNKKDIGTNGWIVRADNPGWIEIFSKENKIVNDGSLYNL